VGCKFELLTWDMEPGDCLVHHSFAVHGAPGISTQSERRRAYATRWFGEDVRFDPRPGTSMQIDLLVLWNHVTFGIISIVLLWFYTLNSAFAPDIVEHHTAIYMYILRWLIVFLSWIWELLPC
jgi:hypothetical protein